AFLPPGTGGRRDVREPCRSKSKPRSSGGHYLADAIFPRNLRPEGRHRRWRKKVRRLALSVRHRDQLGSVFPASSVSSRISPPTLADSPTVRLRAPSIRIRRT